jgi:chemotaxis signal transduction protein
MATGSFGHSGSQTGSRASSTTAQTGASEANTARAAARRTICAFWIGDRCFGLDTSLVAEVVSVEEQIPIPLTPPAVQGIFNLRGEPLPLISLADILGTARESSAPKVTTAMVFRSGGLAAGLVIDRVQAILPLDSGALMPPANATEDASILGFLEAATDRLTTVVGVIDPTILLEKLMQLRFQRDAVT